MSDDQNGCECVNVSSGMGLPWQYQFFTARIKATLNGCVCVCVCSDISKSQVPAPATKVY